MSESKESIFITALRSFLKGFFSILGIFLAFIPIMLVLGIMLAGKDTYAPKNSIQFLPDLQENTQMLPEKDPVILQIDIQGIIGMDATVSEVIKNQLIESRKGILKKERVKAILLNINTPGGTVFDSDNIYQMLMDYKEQYKVPVYAFINGLCASGGIYIASAADKIFSTPVSLIGSVGVVMGPFFNISKTLEKVGIDSLTITDGKNKDMLNPLRPWEKNEDETFRKINDYYYERFLNIVTKARPNLSKEKLISTYGAAVFPAPVAQDYDYIDNGNSSYKEALKELLLAAKIDEKSPYQVVKLSPKKNLLEEMFSHSALFKGKISHELNLGTSSKMSKTNSFFYFANPF